jgi:hypothetical protein
MALRLRKLTNDLVLWKGTFPDRYADPLSQADFGNPLAPGTGHDQTLCLYDASGGPPALLFRARAPAGGDCNGRPCWTEMLGDSPPRPMAYRYVDRERTPEGVQRIRETTLRDSLRLLVSGGGANLQPPPLPLPLPARMQLQVTDGQCYEATYSAAGLVENSDTRFHGRSD